MLGQRFRLWTYLALACGAACSSESGTKTVVLTGSVVADPNGTALAGATITADNLKSAVATDANGQFSLPATEVGKTVTLRAHMDGFADVVRRVTVSDGVDASFMYVAMRGYTSTDITLPNPGDAPATASASAMGGKATLIIPAGALATAGGAIATGAATVQMTYWSYDDWKVSHPVPMQAMPQDGNKTPIDLVTYGMADMKVVQDGQELVVADNQTLQLQFTIPEYQHSLLQTLVAGDTYAPNFYSGDQNQGYWIREGKLSDGALVFDANAMTFTGTMKHMSAWNLDGCHLDYGGCVAGTLVGPDGKTPMPNTNVRIWLLTRDEIKDYIVQTDASGNYCQNIGTNQGFTTSNYYLSSDTDVNASNMCNPMSSFSSDCVGDAYGYGERWCTQSAFRNEAVCSDTDNGDINGQIANIGCNPYPACNSGSSPAQMQACPLFAINTGQLRYGYSDSCSPATPLVGITACGWCPGTANIPSSCSGADYRTGVTFNTAPNTTSCGALKTITYTPGVVTPDPPPPGTNFQSVCQNATVAKFLATPCEVDVDCCATATKLVCQDKLCVYASDNY